MNKYSGTWFALHHLAKGDGPGIRHGRTSRAPFCIPQGDWGVIIHHDHAIQLRCQGYIDIIEAEGKQTLQLTERGRAYLALLELQA